MKLIEYFSFKKGKIGRFLFSNTFYAFAIATVLFEIFCSFLIYYFSYDSYRSRIRSQMVIEADRIEVTLQDVFSETQQVMTYIGKQIALYSEKDPHFIEKILVNSPEFVSKIKNIYSWSLFDWVDSNNYRVVNSQIGLIQDTPMKVEDSYTWKCPKNPWTLQLSHPAIGNTSGMWVIPAGLGVLNKNYKYFGSLSVGFNIAELNTKVQQTLASKEISFIILDDDMRIVLQSADNAIDPKSSYYRDLLSGEKYFKEEKNYLSPPVFYKNLSYIYYKKIKNYPYIILTGFDETIVQQEFLALLLPRLLELYGVGAFCLCLLYLLRKKIFKLGRTSEKDKNTFFQRINLEMKESIDIIIAYSNIIIKDLKRETVAIVTQEKKIEFIEKIYEEALNLNSIVGTTLNLSYISLQTLIEESISILIETALENSINIKVSVGSNLLPFYGDELRIKQIIVGLIYLSMNYSPKNSIIKISALNKLSNEGRMLLIIRIEDNGFSLNADDMMRISEKFSYENKEKNWEGSLDFLSIEKLIRLHKGTCYVCNEWQRGKIINVTLPYESEELYIKTKESISKENNIHWLSQK